MHGLFGYRTFRINQCPVCGENLGHDDLLNDMIHMSLCFDEGTGSHIMTGGFMTDKQASDGYAISNKNLFFCFVLFCGLCNLTSFCVSKIGSRICWC
jgi:hypothetical protein